MGQAGKDKPEDELRWPDTSRSMINYGDLGGPGGIGQHRPVGGDVSAGMPARRRWPLVVAIILLLVIAAVGLWLLLS